VHAFVVSRVDYCLGLLAGAPTSCNVSSTQSLETCQVRPWSHTSLPVTCSTLARRSWPDPTQTVRPGVQMSTQHGSWLPGPSSADLSPASTDTGIYDLLAVTTS